MEALAVEMAQKVPGHPVKLRLSREEEFFCSFVRQGLVAKTKIGASSDGKLVAMKGPPGGGGDGGGGQGGPGGPAFGIFSNASVATTENPIFACNSALVSRSTLFRLEALDVDDIVDYFESGGALQIGHGVDALHLAFVRSDIAHGSISAIDVSDAGFSVEVEIPNEFVILQLSGMG